MIEQGFNHTDPTVKEMTDFFDSRGENLEPREDKKLSSVAAKKTKDKKSFKKCKQEYFNSSGVESSKEYSV